MQPSLPQLAGAPFLTDGGLETSLVFLQGMDLPAFAAFPLLLDEAGRAALDRYIEPYLEIARARKLGFVLDTPTWRANADWGAKLGFDDDALAEVNAAAVDWADAVRRAFASPDLPIVINGVIGPRGDGYRPTAVMDAAGAWQYHAAQVGALAAAGVDMVSAITINYAEEAIGIAASAKAEGVPAVISFTVETDGRLASGESLRSAVERTDAATDASPAYYMINCAHPTHLDATLADAGAWTGRIRGLRANASAKSHAELDEATTLDRGDPVDLALRYRGLRQKLPGLAVLGGCCGTDHRHIAAICEACLV